MLSFSPPYTPLGELQQNLRQNGFALLKNKDFFAFTDTTIEQWDALKNSWNDLEIDTYLKDGGKYRKRRHANLIVHNAQLKKLPYRPHFQPTSYNALHGGMQRWFNECTPNFLHHPALEKLFLNLGELFDQLYNKAAPDTIEESLVWCTEIHQFRIDTADGIGRPTPEGAHRDGVNYVAVLLVDRHQVKGGESRVFSANGPQGLRFTLDEAWTLLLLDDNKVIHETTPIQPLDPDQPEQSWRDTLVLTFRKNNFLEAQTTPSNSPEHKSRS